MPSKNKKRSLVGNAESVMKDKSDPSKRTDSNPDDIVLKYAAAQNLYASPQYHQLSVFHQQYLANLRSSQTTNMLYPNMMNPALNPYAQNPLISGMNHGAEKYLHSITLQQQAAYAELSEASRQAEIVRILQTNKSRDFLLQLSQMSQSTSGASASSPIPSAQRESPHNVSELSPPENQTRRSSSISPSAYMTPISLTGSPPDPPMSPSNHNGRSPLSSGSQTSPSEIANRVIDSNIVTTPIRKPATSRPEKQFQCKVCNKTFGYKHVLQNHERTHTGEKPFKCLECGKRFTRDHHLKTHKRLHTGEKPYKCPHCDRNFVQVANLRRHVRVHTGEKPYICETCNLKFSDSNQLKAHILTHTGEKPYSCSKCQARFRRRHHMLNHKCPDEDMSPSPPDTGLFANQEMREERIQNTNAVPYEELLNGSDQYERRRGRKNKAPKRILHKDSSQLTTPSPPRLESTGLHFITSPQLPPTPLPEQTEPEDLSMNSSSKSQSQTYRANIAVTAATNFVEPIPFPKEELMSDEESLSVT